MAGHVASLAPGLTYVVGFRSKRTEKKVIYVDSD